MLIVSAFAKSTVAATRERPSPLSEISTNFSSCYPLLSGYHFMFIENNTFESIPQKTLVTDIRTLTRVNE